MRSPAFAEGLWEPVEHSFNGLPGTVYNSVLAITFHQCRASRSDASERSGPTLVFPGHGVVQSPTDVCVLLDSQGYTGAFPKPSLPLPVAAWLQCFVLLSRWGHHRVGEWGMSSWTTTKLFSPRFMFKALFLELLQSLGIFQSSEKADFDHCSQCSHWFHTGAGPLQRCP